MATVVTSVSWQVNKLNSLVFPFSFLHCRGKGCICTAQPTLTNNYDLVKPQIEHSKDLFCKKKYFEATDRSGHRLAI